jgi:hypothetical protein
MQDYVFIGLIALLSGCSSTSSPSPTLQISQEGGNGEHAPPPEAGREDDAADVTASADAPSDDNTETAPHGGPDGSVLDAFPLPIDPSTLLSALTPAQGAVACDWMSAELGGYDTTAVCSEGSTVSTASDQAMCAATRLSYRCATATLGDLETCVLAQVPTVGCDFPPPCLPLLCQ